jgi:hypothetical protein
MSKNRKARKTDMLKTLRITSVLVVVLAAVFFVLPAVFGVRSDQQAEQFLTSPGAIDNFTKAKGQKSTKSETQVSPLVKAAEAFALYLNPPKPKPPPPRASREKPGSPPRPRAPVSAKFELIGTSFYASRPELSLALIDEPGEGFRWVRQASEVGHLVIEQVKDGVVVVRDGKRTFELEVQRPKKRSLLKGSTSDARITSTEPAKISRKDRDVPDRGRMRIRRIRSDDPNAPDRMFVEIPEPDSAEVVDDLESSLRAELQEARADEDFEEVSKLQKLISDIETMRIGDQEARRLSRLGQKLQHVQQDPNRTDDANASDPNKAI